MTRPMLNRRQLCALLNVSVDWFGRHRAELEAAGFPKPLAGFPEGKGARWDPVAVEAWLAAQRPASDQVAGSGEVVITIDQVRRRLQERAQDIAHREARRTG